MNDQKAPSKNYRTFALILLTIVYGFNFVDRQILGILAPFIQQDLGLTNTQLGLLSGLLFAAFYTVVAIPIANLKKNKRSPGSIVISALKAEAVKIAVIFIALWLVYKFYVQLVPIALVIGLILSVLISCLAISDIDNINIETKE